MELTAFPSPPVVEVDFSDVPVLSIGFPEVPVSVLPEGFIPNVPWFMVFAGSGSGAATVRAAVAARMTAAGAGTAQVALRTVVAASASGSGKLTAPAYVVGQAFPTSIEAAGAGDTFTSAAALNVFNAAGTGDATATSTARSAIAVASIGTTAVNAYPVRSTLAAATGSGVVAVRAAPTVSAAASSIGTNVIQLVPAFMGMKKVGEWSPGTGSTFNTIPGWSAQAQYPGTAIVGDGIELQAGTYTLTLRLVAGDSFNLTVRSIRILVGATEVVPDTHADSNGWDFTTTVTVPSGVLVVQYYATSSTASRRTVREGTYLTIARA